MLGQFHTTQTSFNKLYIIFNTLSKHKDYHKVVTNYKATIFFWDLITNSNHEPKTLNLKPISMSENEA